MCTACNINVSQPDVATEAFAAELLETVNRGMLAMMIALGHRTGLFDTLATMDGWVTSEQLANHANLNERYVREWLGAMVTGGIVAYDPSDLTYHLPAHHAAVLTRAAGSSNMAPMMQFIAVLGEVETKIADCFVNGGGVPYEDFPRFHEVMAEESAGSVVAGLFDNILPLVPGLMDRLEQGIDVLDIGCGSGRALCAMAQAYPRSRFVGYDLCEPAIEAARAEACRLGLVNIHFATRDVAGVMPREAFDLITGFDVIHDQCDPVRVLANVRKMLRPDGVFLMQDIRASSKLEENIGHPLCPMFYAISTMHCMTVSLAQGGAGLGTVWGEQLAMQMLSDAGFRTTVQTLPHDIMNNWYLARPAA